MSDKGYSPHDLKHGQLILSRFEGESICIGDDIVVTVAGFRGGPKVRLAVSAPPHVQVDRKEIRDRKARESSGRRFYPASGS